jgi:hypothetical protein
VPGASPSNATLEHGSADEAACAIYRLRAQLLPDIVRFVPREIRCSPTPITG